MHSQLNLLVICLNFSLFIFIFSFAFQVKLIFSWGCYAPSPMSMSLVRRKILYFDLVSLSLILHAKCDQLSGISPHTWKVFLILAHTSKPWILYLAYGALKPWILSLFNTWWVIKSMNVCNTEYNKCIHSFMNAKDCGLQTFPVWFAPNFIILWKWMWCRLHRKLMTTF